MAATFGDLESQHKTQTNIKSSNELGQYAAEQMASVKLQQDLPRSMTGGPDKPVVTVLF